VRGLSAFLNPAFEPFAFTWSGANGTQKRPAPPKKFAFKRIALRLGGFAGEDGLTGHAETAPLFPSISVTKGLESD
jgi:hypothetical protein